ncbi:MopE-related protein [Corallococcus terminator]
MRLFQVGVLLVTLPLFGCKTETPAPEGVLRVYITYATFRPTCLTLTVVDVHDASHTTSGEVRVNAELRRDKRTAIILRKAGWSPDLEVTAVAHEGSCDGPIIARESADALFPTEGVTDLELDLSADDADDDGYFAAKQPYPGTDCNDEDADIHPGAVELCDGFDNNCAKGETDAPGDRPFWADEDGDGHGAVLGARVTGCVATEGHAANNDDCNDKDGDVRPGRSEFRCDGQDDNCDGAADNGAFSVGERCTTLENCTGTFACANTSASACVSTAQPTEYFVDDDGDGAAGHSVGRSCITPVEGATTENTDCDEGTSVVYRERVEECDRMDNDCNGQTDEGVPGCASKAWIRQPGLVNARFDAVAVYAEKHGWIAGEDNRLVHVADAILSSVTGCPGDWKSAWAANNGRVFLGSRAGRLGTVPAPQPLASCESFNSGHGGAINGLVGFQNETDNVVTLYAVTSQGHILRWLYDHGGPVQVQPEVIVQVSANLKAIHGLDATTLLAVGAETVNGVTRPVVFRGSTDGETWTKEDLGVSDTRGFLNAVQVLTPQLAYVAGDGALLLQRSRERWTRLPALTVSNKPTPNLRSLRAFGRTAIYAVSSEVNDVHFFNGTTWSTVSQSQATLNALGGSGPMAVWATGHGGTLLRWTP